MNPPPTPTDMNNQTSPITEALKANLLLDAEGYLFPPDHANISQFTKRMYKMLEMQQTGVRFTAHDLAKFKQMQLAFDYYQEALDEEAKAIEENYESDDDDDDMDDDDEEEEDEYDEEE